jgi:hypothetical protein
LAEANVAFHEPANHLATKISEAKFYGSLGCHDAHLRVFVTERTLHDGVREPRR